MKVLNAQLVVSSNAKVSDTPYRAVISGEAAETEIAIEQEIKGNYYNVRSWYLNSLVSCGMPISDSIALDCGAHWQVDSGMFAAIHEALNQ
jgi:hypothetical protein